MQRRRLSRAATGLAATAAAVALTFGVASAEPILPPITVLPAETTPPPPPETTTPPPDPETTTPPPDPETTTTPPTTTPPTTTPPTTKPPGTPGPTSTPKPTTPRMPWQPPRAGESDDGPRSFDPDNLLTTADLTKQIAAADQIWAQITASNTGLSIALKELQGVANQSNALLESLTEARAAEQAATDSAAQAKIELGVLQGRLERARSIVREWAFQAYAEGGTGAEMLSMLDAMRPRNPMWATRSGTCPT